MDGENGGMRFSLKNILVILWAGFSSMVYGLLCLIIAVFNPRTTRRLGYLWNKHLLWVAGIQVKVSGREKLDKNKRYVFIANHQSHIDIPVLYVSLQHQLSFIAKKELFMIPFFGWGMYALGHIWIDRSNPRKARNSIIRAVERLQKDGISLVLFPEGTRTAPGERKKYGAGGAMLAEKSGYPIVPITHNAGVFWRRRDIRKYPGTIQLVVGPIIETKGRKASEINAQVEEWIESATAVLPGCEVGGE